MNPLTSEQKHNLFGRIIYTPAPTLAVPEAIRITNHWRAEWLVSVEVPQLAMLHKKYPALFPRAGKIFWNKEAKQPLLVLFRELEKRDLLKDVLAWGGDWAPRFIRKNQSVLSSHAWATAFDINAAWNGLGKEPAARNKTGCVLDIVPVAEECGFYWGGNFTRKDGMHFELADPDAWVYVERK